MPSQQNAEPEASSRPTARLVARNSALYFFSLALPALTAVFLVPVTVRGLGPSRFGLLALAWAVAEGSGMFDFGLGRATVRFVADATTKGRERIRQVILASLWSQLLAGAVAGALLFALTPIFVRRVFSIAPELHPEAIDMFRVLALHVPVLLGTTALRASLEGAQRFDLSTALRIPSSFASVAVPAAVVALHGTLPTIMWTLLALRVTLLVISTEAVRRTLLGGRWALPTGFGTLREMLGYSGWVAVSAALGPALGSLDRFVVGSVVGVAALGYYTGAAEAATRFLLIPVTAFSALLPALSATDSRGERARALRVTRAARRQLAAVMLPLCLALFAFAEPILKIWLGSAYANEAGAALRILSVGVLFGGLAHLPMALLYGSGRPDLPAKVHMGEIIVHVPLTFFLVRNFGITGAAAAWTLRCAADLTLYEWASRRALGSYQPDKAEWSRAIRLSLAAAWLAAAFAGAMWLRAGSWRAALIIAFVGVAVYVAIGWSRVFSIDERRAWIAMLSRTRAPVR
ncbi:MAG TPA: flippase [Gemmatimonadaceae bacterium]|nr:flippase [Gemmatimonadaceae bacterium]